jgi:tetratricopeptide (TPR) repeat protein
MLSIIVAAAIGLLFGLTWVLAGLWGGWILGFILFTIFFLGTTFLLTRWIGKKVQPPFLQAQKQLQAGQTALALKTLEGLLPMSRWQVLLRSQIEAQIGTIYYGMGDEAKALEHLRHASPRIPEALLLLGGMHFRAGRHADAKKALESAIRFNRKNALLANAYAYFLAEKGDTTGAIAQLQRLLKADKSDKATAENLSRLQNGKKMSMKPFGLAWYSLKVERLPGSLRQQGVPHPGMHGRHRFR